MLVSNACTTSDITIDAILDAAKRLQRQKVIREMAWDAMIDTLINPLQFHFSDDEIENGMRVFYPSGSIRL